MKFEDFERKIWDMGYGIVAMNHYWNKGIRYTYCVVVSRKGKRLAFKDEGKSSGKVFENIYKQITSGHKANA